jgi:hypothetical protein
VFQTRVDPRPGGGAGNAAEQSERSGESFHELSPQRTLIAGKATANRRRPGLLHDEAHQNEDA